MTIKITTKSTEIPVQIDDLEFKVDATDENLKRIKDSAIEFQNKLANVENDDSDAVRDAILGVFDLVLGEGAGQKIYEKTGSLPVTIDVLNQLSKGMEKEFAARGLSLSQTDKANQYLQAKQRRNNNRNKRKK